MLPSQRHLFDVPSDVAYLNNASYTPCRVACRRPGRAASQPRAVRGRWTMMPSRIGSRPCAPPRRPSSGLRPATSPSPTPPLTGSPRRPPQPADHGGHAHPADRGRVPVAGARMGATGHAHRGHAGRSAPAGRRRLDCRPAGPHPSTRPAAGRHRGTDPAGLDERDADRPGAPGAAAAQAGCGSRGGRDPGGRHPADRRAPAGRGLPGVPDL